MEPEYKGFENEKISMTEATRRLKDGCSGCGTCCEFGERECEDDAVLWIGKNEYLCEECFDGDWHQIYSSSSSYTLGERIDDDE